MMQHGSLAVLAVALGALWAGAALAQDADLDAKGAKVFRRCAACHKIGPGADNEVGPSLNGLIGRTAGTEAGFTYSDAMKQAGEGGLVWSNDTLFAYLENPKAMVPGTKMAFAGLKSEDDRHAVIAYIDAHGGEE
ncbi:MAG: cytochrome c family protein [Amaricoccus sp.]